MARKDDERPFRLRPPKPKARREGSAVATGFKRLMHYARASGAGRRGGGSARSRPAHNQRCAVRVTYSKNATKGQWRAHGRYLARVAATFEIEPESGGFSAENERIDMARDLDRWQGARDPLLWKLILSPEFGDRLDLPQLTHEVMGQMAKDLRTDLEWVAVAHYNTDHPHIHIALRGLRADGQALQLNRDYIKRGIRNIAEEACTLQLGYRTQLDVAEAERREISEFRFTSLDRFILRRASDDLSDHLNVTIEPARDLSGTSRQREQHAVRRLATLGSLGLAEQSGPNVWRVQQDFESVLRAIQRTNDRQKTLAAHGAVPSDERLPIQVLEWDRHGDAVQGRVLVHGQEEGSGRNYLMLEGTDAAIHFIYYSPEMELARSLGGLRTNSFIRLRRQMGSSNKSIIDVAELGDADSLLKNHKYFQGEAHQLVKHGIVPSQDGWGGWLGRYQRAMRQGFLDSLSRDARHKDHQPSRGPEHGR